MASFWKYSVHFRQYNITPYSPCTPETHQAISDHAYKEPFEYLNSTFCQQNHHRIHKKYKKKGQVNKTWLEVAVSENSGIPKSSILIGVSIINHPFWGTPIVGNIQVSFTQKNNKILSFDLSRPVTWRIRKASTNSSSF